MHSDYKKIYTYEFFKLGTVVHRAYGDFVFCKSASGTGVIKAGMSVTIDKTAGAYTVVPTATDGINADGAATAYSDSTSADKYLWIQIGGRYMEGAVITSSLLSTPTTAYDGKLVTDGSTAGVLKPFAASSSGDPSDDELNQVAASKFTAQGTIRYLTGTVSLTEGDTEVIGSGTEFFSEVVPGDNIVLDAGGTPQVKIVSTINSRTSLTITASGSVISGGTAAVGRVPCELG
jgi:hypothetical protein